MIGDSVRARAYQARSCCGFCAMLSCIISARCPPPRSSSQIVAERGVEVVAELDLREPAWTGFEAEDKEIRLGAKAWRDKMDVGVHGHGSEFSEHPFNTCRNDLVAGVDEQDFED